MVKTNVVCVIQPLTCDASATVAKINGIWFECIRDFFLPYLSSQLHSWPLIFSSRKDLDPFISTFFSGKTGGSFLWLSLLSTISPPWKIYRELHRYCRCITFLYVFTKPGRKRQQRLNNADISILFSHNFLCFCSAGGGKKERGRKKGLLTLIRLLL